MNTDIITQAIWQPTLIRLTAVAMPNVPEGPCFINPFNIDTITRGEVVHKHHESGTVAHQLATYVSLGYQRGVWVTEQPEQIARMREEAFGHKPAWMERVK